MSNRYISDRFLPDKAIDLVDEAAAKLRTEIDSMPTELDESMRRVMQLEIEREALKKEKDAASRDRLDKLEKELADVKSQADALPAQWEAEKEAVQQHQPDCASRSSRPGREIEQAKRDNKLAEARSSCTATCPNWNANSSLGRLEAPPRPQTGTLIKEEVGEEDIAKIISRWTGIPVEKLLEGEVQKLLHLGEELHKRVVGQDEAVQAVADAVMRARSGLKDPQSADRLVHLSRPDRRRQDRTGPRPGRVPLRR